jgi:hypothetical protein
MSLWAGPGLGMVGPECRESLPTKFEIESMQSDELGGPRRSDCRGNYSVMSERKRNVVGPDLRAVSQGSRFP